MVLELRTYQSLSRDERRKADHMREEIQNELNASIMRKSTEDLRKTPAEKARLKELKAWHKSTTR